jgi:glycosyltransferase involved in cell wall biosynthesis
MVASETRLPDPTIAFDVTPLQNAHRYRGIGTYVRGLAHRLAAQTDVPIEFWGWAGDDSFEAPAPHRTLSVARFPMPEYRGAWLFAQLAMRRRASRSSVRAVHITDPDALTPLARRALLTTVYDLIPLKEGVQRRRAVAWAGYRSYLAALRRADILFAISNSTRTDLVDIMKLQADRIVVAPPGIDLNPSDDGAVGAAKPYFLFLGGPNANKNVSVLLEAMAIGRELPEGLRIGGRWLPKQVADLNGRLKADGLRDRVQHVGFVPAAELAALMRDATALIVPSRHEGFGLPVGEGMAAGAAVLHSRIPVLEETSAGAALTFDPDSAEDLVTLLRRVSGDERLRNDLRRRGIERARELTWDVAVERTLATYRAVLER